jgi:hypothetical protein
MRLQPELARATHRLSVRLWLSAVIRLPREPRQSRLFVYPQKGNRMTKSLTRALRRRTFMEANGDPRFGKVSIPNLYGNPIGKPICIRSIRRANRRWLKLWRQYPGSSTPNAVYNENSSCRVARAARLLKANIRFDQVR